MNRVKVLNMLIKLSAPISRIKQDLEEFSWDSEPLVILSRQDIINIITKYKNGDISKEDFVEWGNLLESRDDIEFDPTYEDEIKNLIFNIANPDIGNTQYLNYSIIESDENNK